VFFCSPPPRPPIQPSRQDCHKFALGAVKRFANSKGVTVEEVKVRIVVCLHCNTLQHTATHCNTLQHTATHCNTLQHTATNYNTLQYTATHCFEFERCDCGRGQDASFSVSALQLIATYCSTLTFSPLHNATQCNAKQHPGGD